MRAQRIRGYTFIELLTAVVVFLASCASLPSLANLIHESRQTAQLYALLHMLDLARFNAIDGNKTITLCGSKDGVICERDWDAPTILIFYDLNGDHTYQTSDQLIHRTDLASTNWHWRGSGERPYLRFRNDGTAMEFGRFTICPEGKLQRGAQIVINFAGRPYVKSVSRNQLQTDQLCL